MLQCNMTDSDMAADAALGVAQVSVVLLKMGFPRLRLSHAAKFQNASAMQSRDPQVRLEFHVCFYRVPGGPMSSSLIH